MDKERMLNSSNEYEPAAAAVAQLRAASLIVEQYVPAGTARTDLLRRLGLLIADMEGCPTRDCRTCSIRFGLSRGEASFYRDRGLTLPTHCRQCRAKRRSERSV